MRLRMCALFASGVLGSLASAGCGEVLGIVGIAQSAYRESDAGKLDARESQCDRLASDAHQARIIERWGDLDDAVTGYAQCRRQVVDAGGKLTRADAVIVPELDALCAQFLVQIEGERKAGRFERAAGLETSLRARLGYYGEWAPKNTKVAEYTQRADALKATYRDPDEAAAADASQAFDTWMANVTTVFDREWNALARAEASARPLYTEGMAALDNGDYAAAIAKLSDARTLLFTTAYGSPIALEVSVRSGTVNNGLSYDIAAGLARAYFQTGDRSKLYPELALTKQGRPWLSHDDELHVRLYEILADQRGRREPKATDSVRRFAALHTADRDAWRRAKEKASASIGTAYNMLGVEFEPRTHTEAAADPAANLGKVVYLEAPITSVSGDSITVDFVETAEEAYNCRKSNKVASVNLFTGDVEYEETCDYRTVKGGHSLRFAAAKGIKVTKGDIVALFGTVGKARGTEIPLQNAAYVRIAPDGETAWYMGVKVQH